MLRHAVASIPLLLALTHPVLSVSLSSFLPAVNQDTLTPTCKTVYDASIVGCTDTDFLPPDHCSAGCLSGLLVTNAAVILSCAGDKVQPNSIIDLFQRGKGIMALCNVAVVTATTTMNPGGAMATGAPVPSIPANGTVAPNGPPTTIVLSAVGGSASAAPSAAASMVTSVITSGTSVMTVTMSVSGVNYAQSTSTAPTPSVSAQQQLNNPSKPMCTPGGQNQGSQGSPFDSFNDQLCSGSAAGSLGLNKVLGSLLGISVMVLVWG